MMPRPTLLTTRCDPLATAVPDFPLTIGVMIRKRREELGWSQHQLADRLGFDHSYVSRVESGSRTIALDSAPLFAEVLNIDPYDLVLTLAGLDPLAFRESLTEPLERALAEVEAVIVRYRRDGQADQHDDEIEEAA